MLNNVNLVGRMTADPKFSATDNGTSCCSFTIACQQDYGEKKADFIPCVCWKQTAEFVTRHFTKGAMVCINGRLKQRSWKDKDGNNRSVLEVICQNVYFYGDKKSASAPTADEPAEYPVMDEPDGALPF